jgi:gliding motility-associated lipoprotein GldD
MNIRILWFFLGVLSATIPAGCEQEESYVPKPRGYMRVDYPDARNYVQHADNCGYSFEIPDYGVMVQKTISDSVCFSDLNLHGFNATIYLTYFPVKNNLPTLLEESRQLLIKHQIKATSISDTLVLDSTRKVFAVISKLAGNVASNVQFTATDSTANFLRGSLHFYAAPNYDSLYPMIEYLYRDVQHMVKSLQWNTKQ